MSGVGPQSDSFEALAMPLFDQLYNFAHWLTRNREEAEDLVQETYTKALKGFSSFQLGTNFRAWMYRILRNTFLTTRTGLKVAMTVPLEPEAATTDAKRIRCNRKGDEPCLVSLGRQNSAPTSMVGFRRRRCAPLTFMCTVAVPARQMRLRACR